MTALFTARRRADEFAAAVDGRPGVPDELHPLLSVVAALREHSERDLAAPRADFSAGLRARLVAEAERSLSPDAPLVLPVRQRGPRERRLVAAASVVVMLGGSAGMAAAAQSALPGEALYPLKRGIERAEAGLSVSTAGRGADLLRQADGRLTEVEGLLAGSVTAAPRVPGTIEDFTRQAQEGADLLFASFAQTGDPDDVAAVRRFTAHSIEVLQEIARTAPASAQDELATAAMTLSEIDRRAAALCGDCGSDLPELEVPGIFLAAAEVDRVFTLIDGRLLDNSHPVVADKRMLQQVADAAEATSDPAPADEPTAAPAPAPTDDGPVPGDDPAPGSLLDLADGADVTEGDKPVRKAVDDTVGQLSDGLTGVVETVLPDPQLTDSAD